MFTANTGYLQGGADTKRHTRAVIAVHDISDTHCLGSCALTTDKKNRIMQAIVSQLSPLSPSISISKGKPKLSLYLFWVEGEGVSISWQSMSGEEGD